MPSQDTISRVMDQARSIAKLGFRRWYARQMYEAFAWLTTCLLSGVVFTAILEFVGLRTPGLTPLVTLTVLYFIGLMGLMSFKRFWTMLSRATVYSDSATCVRCDSYGLFEVTRQSERIPVRCRNCGHEWSILK